MNVLSYELRRNFISALLWAISLSFFGCICIQLYGAFTADINFFESILNAYSPEMLKAFGAELTTIRTLPGFYSFCFMYVVLCGAFYALHVGISIVGKELAGKSAEFLYTKPMPRWRILTSKLICALLCLLVINGIYTATTFGMANLSGFSFDTNIFFMMNSALFLSQLLFLALGFLCACCFSKIKSPLTLATGIISIFFLLQMVVNLEPNGILSYLSFLNYVSADLILANNGYDMLRLGLLLLLSIVFIISGYRYFQRRDIHSV